MGRLYFVIVLNKVANKGLSKMKKTEGLTSCQEFEKKAIIVLDTFAGVLAPAKTYAIVI